MAVNCYDKIVNQDILRCASLPSTAGILTEKNLRWLDHVHRMEDSQLSRQLLYSQLKYEKRYR